ncbi:hypothetical protein HYZ99_04095 [Candidatus Peregrinibacteria bacterium]|nr:hypothetical protein [Candidatus Peregrinibacteria bacterium]
MTEVADTVVEDIVNDQKEGQTVDQFTHNVEEQARERTEALREQFGDAVDGVAGDIMDSATSYSDSKREILDINATVGDAHAIGAAAYTNMSDRTVTYDTSAMAYDLKDPGYWERVKEHERIHQEEQAGSYNTQTVTYIDQGGEIVTTDVGAFIEWQPSSRANKTSDLTAEYQQHMADGERLAAVIGSDRIEQALADGDMQGMQREIIEKQLPEMLEQDKINVTIGADIS